MKRLFIIIVLSIITVWGISAQELALDEAISKAIITIEEELPQRASLLLLNIVSPSAAFSNYVLNELTDRLVINRKLAVVDRQNLNAIRQEMNFQYSGEVSDESMVSIGRMLGAHYIVTGTLEERGVNYRLRIRIIIVETARIHTSIILDIKNDTQVTQLIGGANAVEEMERNAKINRPANIRNNWLSVEFSGGIMIDTGWGLSGSARYERMLNTNVSLGANIYYLYPLGGFYRYNNLPDNFDNGHIFGIDAFFRYYPWGKKFFVGIGLGYHNNGNWYVEDETLPSTSNEVSYYIIQNSGFAISADIGWKIDIGKEGGFFIQPGILSTFVIGQRKYDYTNSKNKEPPYNDDDFFTGYFRFYLGAGFAF